MQLAIFVTIAIVFLIILVGSLVIGEIAEHGFEIGHDLVEMVSGQEGADGPAFSGPSPFGLRVISAFGTSFGASGAIATYLHANVVAASLIGVAFGFSTGLIAYQFARFLYAQQSGDVFEIANLAGKTAEVSVAIPGSGAGEVTCIVGGESRSFFARSRDGISIDRGTRVSILEATSEGVVVGLGPPPQAGNAAQSSTGQEV